LADVYPLQDTDSDKCYMTPFSLGTSIGNIMKMLTIPLSKGLNFLGKAKKTTSVTVVSLLFLASATASAIPITTLLFLAIPFQTLVRLRLFLQQIVHLHPIPVADFQMALFGRSFWLQI
jgi:hypothetical protein